MLGAITKSPQWVQSGLAALTVAAAGLLLPAQAGAQVSGAIFTTNSTCSGVDLNIYADKGDVYLNGGPTKPGAASLPDGAYYVQVTAPSGSPVLGTSVGTAVPTPITVAGGVFSPCLQLFNAVSATPPSPAGYDDTPNPGGEYKVWVSQDSTFTNSTTKTDNFKVKGSTSTPPPTATLVVQKFYDTGTLGTYDGTETLISGWQVGITDCITQTSYTTVNAVVDPGSCTVTESDTIESNWIHTTATTVTGSVAAGETLTIRFGNICLAGGGGLTLGFWSNRNGQALFNNGFADIAWLTARNLRNANGSNFDPTNYSGFKNWLLAATATNMAYMLSAQMAAMDLNVNHAKVSSTALIYAPGTLSANSFGLATVGAILTEANNSLGANGLTVASSPTRTYQEALKNALDKANNNLNFVQDSPANCPYTFNAPSLL